MDNRDHYRVKDAIYVSYETVTSGHMKSVLAEENFVFSQTFSASREIYELELDAMDILREVSENNRQLGNFLHNVNKRMTLLCRSLIADELVDNDPGGTDSDISEGGLGFASSRFLTPGTNLALKLLFTPSYFGLSCYGQVRHCRLTEDGEAYRVGVQFMHLDETCERLICRHIVRQQAEERRQRLRQNSPLT
ncbi:MAG: PilZ domain-containing protein [Pseudomonadales bacterium]